jgi:signal transduction histidine kinase/CheY-like chemotaxis protein
MNIIIALVDDRSLAESLRAALPKLDLLLVENTVPDALRRLVSLRPDAIVLDDSRTLGLDALRQLIDAAPTVPVVALLSTAHADAAAAYFMAGARACIAKPFSLEELEQAFERCRTPEPAPAPALDAAPAISASASVTQHQIALRWMGRTMGHAEDTTRLVQGLIDVLVDAFDAARACVLLQANGAVRVAASHGIPAAVANAIQLRFDQGLMRRFEQHPSLIDRRRLAAGDAGEKEMSVLGGRLAMPLSIGGRACGAILLGDKASGIDYDRDEIDLFITLARCTSSCLERAQRHRDSARQQSRLDAVLANITAGVITVGADRKITMMNGSAERILRLSASELLGRSVQKLGSAFADLVLRTMKDGTPRVRQRLRDAALRAELGVSVTPLGAEGAVAIFSILSKEESQSQEEISFSPLWKFLANRVAQEIKNPMVAINTFAQLLPTRYESDEFRREFSDVVQGEVARINQVVEALYEFAAQPRLDLSISDLSKDVQRILSDFEHILKEKGIKLHTEFDSNDTPVRIDSHQFARAVRNVIQNSIEAMPNGGTLKVSTRRDNGRCELVVGDTGTGINEGDRPLVFTPFFSTKEKGMGLGLTLASRILQEHEGTLSLLKDADGSQFVFELPVAAKS